MKKYYSWCQNDRQTDSIDGNKYKMFILLILGKQVEQYRRTSHQNHDSDWLYPLHLIQHPRHKSNDIINVKNKYLEMDNYVTLQKIKLTLNLDSICDIFMNLSEE